MDTINKIQGCYNCRATPVTIRSEEEQINLTRQNLNGLTTIPNSNHIMTNQVIQFNSPVLKIWKQQILDTGAAILQSLAPREVVVSVPDSQTIEALKTLDYVETVTPYMPTVQIQAQYLEPLEQDTAPEVIAMSRLQAARTNLDSGSPNVPLPGILIANFFTEEYRDRAAQIFEAQGIRIAEKAGKTKLVLDLSTKNNALELLPMIIGEVGLKSLEEDTIPRLFNNQACYVIAKNVIPSKPYPQPNDLNLTGEGEIIAIADTGLDTGDINNLHTDFQGRVIDIKSYPPSSGFNSYFSNLVHGNKGSDRHTGHGTHVAGSALGSGEQARILGLPSVPSGTAPKAKLIFQAIEQNVRDNNGEIRGQLDVPKDTEELFQYAYEKGAFIHSNSWGGGDFGVYNARSEDIDKFMWEHKNFLILVAAGNYGQQIFSANNIEQESVTPPGTAKNCLTVGASENYRPEFPETYGNLDPQSFPYAPIHSDRMSDSPDDIVAFSSRGPCKDGRIKPDVVAPGTFILSTRSSRVPSNHFAWGAYPPAQHYYMYMGGTSMATPLVAGCAALVRQYLRNNKNITNPTAALVKATLIHSAKYLDYRYAHPSSQPPADNEQGWGRVDLAVVLNPVAPAKVLFIDETQGLEIGEIREHLIEVLEESIPLKATLVYTDYPGKVLQNNLHLSLISPTGIESGNPDDLNNIEGVFIPNPERGKWTVKVMAVEINFDAEDQDYALVVSGILA